MFRLTFMDGTPVDPGYAASIEKLIAGAAQAQQTIDADELEAFAATQATAKAASANPHGLTTSTF